MTGAVVRSTRVPDDEAPSPEVIVARIDLGTACYHESCCPFTLWQADESLFTSMPSCDCGGEEMAKVYASLASLSREERERLGIPIGPVDA